MKKFILFIVEGQNDAREIQAMLHTPYFEEYYEKYTYEFIAVNGDLLTNTKDKTEIQQKITKIIVNYRKREGPYPNISVSDIQEIVHIIDLDGTFIPRDNIIRGDNSMYYYTDDSIVTSNVDGARGRNKKKSEAIKKLINVKQIDNIPYSIYFVSCNMDHLLFNERNPSSIDKRSRSLEFASSCKEHPEILRESVFGNEIASTGNYIDSWEEMQEGCMSLSRCTNFNLFFSNKAKNDK